MQTQSQSRWDYWDRVYSDENSRNNVAIRDMRITDMLSSECLIRAKLLFLNVPGLPTGQKNIILNLIKKELGEEVPIQGVEVLPGKWSLSFYRAEDALRVMQAFNGFNYRAHLLVVRVCLQDGTFGDEAALKKIVECNVQAKEKICVDKEVVQETVSPACWNPTEFGGICTFEEELTELLEKQTHVQYQTAIASVRNTFLTKGISSYFVSDAITQWPIGFLRLFQLTIKSVGPNLCLASSAFYAQKMQDILTLRGNTAPKELWEPFLPDDIRTEIQLVQYFIAFIKNFGPQHVNIDIPIRILVNSLRGTWPRTGRDLADHLAKCSSQFSVINDVLYLSAHDEHHWHVIDNLAAYQVDSDEAMSVGIDFDQKSAEVIDFDRLTEAEEQ